MSTRANIVLTDGHDKLFFYRHSDGYPEGAMPTLEKFLAWVISGKIRDNVGQAAGWLIMLGNSEYNVGVTPDTDWKVGSMEPTAGIHGDVEYIYTIDLVEKTIETEEL